MIKNQLRIEAWWESYKLPKFIPFRPPYVIPSYTGNRTWIAPPLTKPSAKQVTCLTRQTHCLHVRWCLLFSKMSSFKSFYITSVNVRVIYVWSHWLKQEVLPDAPILMPITSQRFPRYFQAPRSLLPLKYWERRLEGILKAVILEEVHEVCLFIDAVNCTPGRHEVECWQTCVYVLLLSRWL